MIFFKNIYESELFLDESTYLMYEQRDFVDKNDSPFCHTFL